MTKVQYRKSVSLRVQSLTCSGIVYQSINRTGWRYIDLCRRSGMSVQDCAKKVIEYKEYTTERN